MSIASETLASPSRRHLLKGGAAAGIGLVVGFHWSGGSGSRASAASADPAVFAPNAFIRISPDNVVTLISKHTEMGQGIYTGLATLAAEELDADWSQMRVEVAPANLKLYEHVYLRGWQITGGSTSTAGSWQQLRKAGATARFMLVGAAALAWRVPAGEITVEKGVVAHSGSGHKASFGELALKAAMLPVPQNVPLKAPADFKLIGQRLGRIDTPAKTDGTAQFTMDVAFPGMLTAVVAHAPRFGGVVQSFDDAATRQIPGVVNVVRIPTGVAVVARSFWAAKRGRDALQVVWDDSKAEKRSSPEIMAEYKALVAKPGKVVKAVGPSAKLSIDSSSLGTLVDNPAGKAALEKYFPGLTSNPLLAQARGMSIHDVKQALPGVTDEKLSMLNADLAKIPAGGSAVAPVAKRLTAKFEFPYLAHATMEPLDCVVSLTKDACEIWSGTQGQSTDQEFAAKAAGLAIEQVQIHTQYAGGGFGRRGVQDGEYTIEAVAIAKAMGADGTPVKLVWTREDDIRGGRYRPMVFHAIEGGLDAAGNLVAWHHRIVGQDNLTLGAADVPYAIPDLVVETHTAVSPVSTHAWRGVDNTHNAFVVETFIDELAHAAGKDPIELRTALLTNQPRYLKVMSLAAEKAGWGEKLPAGRGRGFAVHHIHALSAFVAQVADVTIGSDGKIKVDRVVCAIDCGIAVNPDVVRAQVEGGIGFGLGAILYGAITLKEGRIEQSNFHDYRVLRISEMPSIEVHIVPSTESPIGVGEPPVPPVGPAVANAIFAATGKRVRVLPLARNMTT